MYIIMRQMAGIRGRVEMGQGKKNIISVCYEACRGPMREGSMHLSLSPTSTIY